MENENFSLGEEETINNREPKLSHAQVEEVGAISSISTGPKLSNGHSFADNLVVATGNSDSARLDSLSNDGYSESGVRSTYSADSPSPGRSSPSISPERESGASPTGEFEPRPINTVEGWVTGVSLGRKEGDSGFISPEGVNTQRHQANPREINAQVEGRLELLDTSMDSEDERNRKSSFDTDDQGSIDARDAKFHDDLNHHDDDDVTLEKQQHKEMSAIAGGLGGYENQISYVGFDVTKSQNPFLHNIEHDCGIEDVDVRKISNDSSFSMETASAAIDKAFSSLDNDEMVGAGSMGVGEITVGIDVVKQNPIFDNDFDRNTSSPIEEVACKDGDMSESSDEEKDDEFVSIKAVEPTKEIDESVSETEFMSLKATNDAGKDVDTSYDDTEYISMQAHETSADLMEAPTKDVDTSVSDTEYCVEAKLEIKLDDKVNIEANDVVDNYSYEASGVDDDEAAYKNVQARKVAGNQQ
jgi:hypothetical protein